MNIFVLDKGETIVGVLSNDAPKSCPFYDDIHIENVRTGINSFEFSVPASHETVSKIEVEGSVIFPDLDGKLQMFKVKNIEEVSTESEYVKHITTEHIAISELLTGGIVRPFEMTNISLNSAITYILSDTDFGLVDGQHSVNHNIKVEKHSTILEVLYYIAEIFQVEIQYDVTIKNGRVSNKLVHMKEKLGTVTNKLFSYSKDLVDVVRTENSEALITAVVGVGKGDQDGELLTLDGHNPTKLPVDYYKDFEADFIYSEVALQAYGNNGKHRYGIYISDTDNVDTLTDEVVQELKARSVPFVTYEMKVVTLERISGYEADKVRVGDTINAKDVSMKPTLMIEARVLEVRRSYTNPENDEIVLGNYRPVKINAYEDIESIRQAIIANEEKWANAGISIPEVEEIVDGKIVPLERDLNDIREDLRTKEYAIIKQDEKPEGTEYEVGQLWIDGEDFIYQWTGTDWKKLISVSLSDINGIDVDAFEKKVADMEADYLAKIETATDDATAKVADMKVQVDAKLDIELYEKQAEDFKADISSKLDTTDFTNKVIELTGDIATKLDADVYAEKVADIETNIATKLDASIYSDKVADIESRVASKVDSDIFTNTVAGITSNINTKADTEFVDGQLRLKANADAVYTKVEADGKLNDKADGSTTYTKIEVDNALDSKVSGITFTENIDGIITDLETHESRIKQTELGLESTVSTTEYSQKVAEIEGNVSNKADTSKVTALETRIGTAETGILQTDKAIKLKADTESVYTKTEVDTSLGGKASTGSVTAVETSVQEAHAELEVQAGLIASKVASKDYSQKVSEIESAVGKKANTTTVTAIDTRLKSAETGIIQSDKAIALKANSEDVYTKSEAGTIIDTKVSTAKGELTVTTDAITQAVSKVNTTIDEHGIALTEHDALFTVQANQIASKVASTDYAQKVSAIESDIGKKANTSTVTAIDTRLKTAETGILQTDKAIELKANSEDVYTKTEAGILVDSSIDTAKAGIKVTTDAITQEVTKVNSTVDEHGKAITEQGASIEVQAGQIASKVSNAVYTEKVTAIESDVGKKANTVDVYNKGQVDTKVNAKANSSDVSAIETRLKSAESSITQTDADIKLKVNAEDVYTKTEVNTSLSDKADNTSVSAIEERVKQSETSIEIHDGLIASKAEVEDVYSKTESDGKVSTAVTQAKSEVKQTTDAIIQSVTGLEETVTSQGTTVAGHTASIKNLGTSIESKVEASEMKKAIDGTVERIESAESRITQNEEGITSKVSSSVYAGDKKDITDRLTTAETALVQTDKSIALKANASDVYSKTETNTRLNDKASTSDVSVIEERVTGTESSLEVQAGQIASKVSGTDYSKKVTEIETSVGKKADTSRVVILETSVKDANTAILQNKNSIALKAEASSVYTKGEVDTSLGGKASTGDVKALETIVTDNKASLEVQAGQIASKVSSTVYSEKISQIDTNLNGKAGTGDLTNLESRVNGKLAKKAETSTVTAIESRLATAETSIVETDKQIALKASASDVYTKTQVDSSLGSKANANDVNLIEQRVTAQDAQLTVQAGQIASKVASSDYSKKVSEIVADVGKKANTTTVNTALAGKASNADVAKKANTTTVTAIETRLKTAETGIVQTNEAIQLKAEKSDVYTKTEAGKVMDTKVTSAKADIKVTTDAITQEVNKVNTAVNTQGKTISEHTASIKNLGTSIESKVSSTQMNTAVGDAESRAKTHADTKASTAESNAKSYAGTQATGAETRAKSHANTLNTAMTTRITTAESRITQTEKDINLRVTSTTYNAGIGGLTTRMATAEAGIKVQAGQISSKVASTDFTGTKMVSLINQTASTVKIQAKNIDIQGAVTFSAFDSATAGRISTAENNASTAKTDASSAKSTAGSAVNTANSANTKAGSAETKANSAVSTADTANTTANTARNTANSANSTAGTANSTANTARNTANTANTNASSAVNRVSGVESKINNAVTTIDGKGITVKGGSFYLEDEHTGLKSSAVFGANVIMDHSFEGMLQGAVINSTDSYAVASADNIWSGWSTTNSPRMISILNTDTNPQFVMFGYKSILVNNSNYVNQFLHVAPNTTFTASLHVRKAYNYTAGTSRIRIRYYDWNGKEIGSLHDGTFPKNQRTDINNRHSTTFTTPPNTDYIRFHVYAVDSQWVLVDGIQLVEGGSPTPYNPEDGLQQMIGGLTYLQHMQGESFRGKSISSVGDFSGDSETVYRSNRGFVALRSEEGGYAYLQGGEARVVAPRTASSYRPIRASSFPTGSSMLTKSNHEEFTGEDAMFLLDNANVQKYHLNSNLEMGIYDKPKIGMYTQTIPALLRDEDGVDTYSIVSALWRVAQTQSKEIKELKETLYELMEVL